MSISFYIIQRKLNGTNCNYKNFFDLFVQILIENNPNPHTHTLSSTEILLSYKLYILTHYFIEIQPSLDNYRLLLMDTNKSYISYLQIYWSSTKLLNFINKLIKIYIAPPYNN